jgi:hypothetical protein
VIFELSDSLAAALGKLAVRIEHVGSTSVPGLAVKPTIDIDVVIRSRNDLAAAIERLQRSGISIAVNFVTALKDVMHSIVCTARLFTISACARKAKKHFAGTLLYEITYECTLNLWQSIRKSSALWHLPSAPTSAPTRMQRVLLSMHFWNGDHSD